MGATISGPTVTTTSSTVLAEDHERVWASITNDGDEVAYFNVGGGAAVAGQGIRRAPGETLVLAPVAGVPFNELWPMGAVTAVTASGTTTLSIFEESQ